MQNNLFNRAKAYRDEHSKTINTLADFKSYFASEEEIKGGFAMCHFVDEPSSLN